MHDFVEKGRVSLSHCNFLVLDEADRMLDMGFMPEIQKMVENEDMPKKAPEGNRQTLMFSATFPDEVQESAQEFLADDYLFLTVGLVGGACSDVKQVIDKLVLIFLLLRRIGNFGPIFCCIEICHMH